MNDIIDTPAVYGIPVRPFSVRSGVLSAWYGHVPFAYWVIEAARPKVVVELGAHNGVSYSAFCDRIASLKLDARCFAIDTWQGDDHAGWYGEDVYNDLFTFNEVRFGSFSRLVRSTFAEALDHFADDSIDLLHVDGRHSYEDVKNDYLQYLPKLSDRAVVLFHDINVRERGFGVWKLWDEIKDQKRSFEFYHSHGLGVLCVGSKIPEKVLALMNTPAELLNDVREVFANAGHVCVLESEVKAKEALVNDLQRQTTSASQAMIVEREQAHELDLARLRRLGSTQERSAHWLGQEVERLRDQNLEHVRAAQIERARLDQLSARLRDCDAALALTKEHLDAIKASSAWRLTGPFRRLAEKLPAAVLRQGRRSVKLAYWLSTPWKARQRMKFLQDRRAMPSASGTSNPRQEDEIFRPSPPTLDRFSLTNLTPANRKCEWPAFRWYEESTPKVSIVILNWNRCDMTLRCLEYIFQHTSGCSYEVVIIDNGSTQEELDRLTRLSGPARVVSLGVNRYFGEANNIGVESAKGEYVCLLNNDAFVHDGWLAPLLDVISNDPTIGAIGPKFLYPDGILQEAGALVQPDGIAVQLGKGKAGNSKNYDKNRRVDYISAACCLMKRSSFIDVLGFDLMYDPAYFEDADLCLKLRLAGLSTWYCASSTVTHIENATSVGTKNELGLGSIVEINRTKFVARWGEYLTGREHAEPALIPASGSDLIGGPDDRTIAIYTPYNLTPGGGERFLLTIAEAFRGQSVNVTLITPYPFSKIRIRTMGRELGIELDHVQLETLSNAHELKIDHLFIIGNEITPSIYGFGARNTYICQFPFPLENPDHLNQTRANWLEIDDVICYSQFVKTEICRTLKAADLPDKPIHILAAPVPLINRVGEKNRRSILHVGRFFAGGHSKRQDILIDTAKRLVDDGAGISLHLVGSLHPELEHRAYYADLVEKASGYPIYFHPNCSLDQLDKFYVSSGIYWHATGYGVNVADHPERMEHFGISVIEAMSAGCIPVVFGEGGPQSIVRDGEIGYHFHTKDELFEHTKRLLEMSDIDFADMATRSREDAAQYGSDNFKEMVRDFCGPFART